MWLRCCAVQLLWGVVAVQLPCQVVAVLCREVAVLCRAVPCGCGAVRCRATPHGGSQWDVVALFRLMWLAYSV